MLFMVVRLHSCMRWLWILNEQDIYAKKLIQIRSFCDEKRSLLARNYFLANKDHQQQKLWSVLVARKLFLAYLIFCNTNVSFSKENIRVKKFEFFARKLFLSYSFHLCKIQRFLQGILAFWQGNLLDLARNAFLAKSQTIGKEFFFSLQ